MSAEDEIRTCADGTSFMLWSEHVRGEPRWYSIVRRDPGTPCYISDTTYDGSTDKRVVIRRLDRLAAEHDKGVTHG